VKYTEYISLYYKIIDLYHTNISLHSKDLYIQDMDKFMMLYNISENEQSINDQKTYLQYLNLKYILDNWSTFKFYPPNTKRI